MLSSANRLLQLSYLTYKHTDMRLIVILLSHSGKENKSAYLSKKLNSSFNHLGATSQNAYMNRCDAEK